jgi:O-methyltransferase
MRRVLERSEEVLLKLPFLVDFLLSSKIGKPYGVGFWGKVRLVVTFHRNTRRVKTLSSVVEHLELAADLLRLPREVAGDVVECGCFEGGSTVNLSIACELVGRSLIVCDSFEGLPSPKEYDLAHPVPHREGVEEYHEGQFAASLDVVKANVARWGCPEVCEFRVGFFDKTMPNLNRPVAMAFLDVDLIDSLRPCLMGIWPGLASTGRVYVHEAGDLDLVATFFESEWWRDALDVKPPGFVGAGTGLPLMPIHGSELGYAQKGSRAKESA